MPATSGTPAAGTPPEQQQTTPSISGQAPAQGGAEDHGRDSDWAKGLFGEMARLKAQLESMQAEKKKILEEQEAAKKAREEAELKAQGKYDELIKRHEAEREAEKAAYSAEKRSLELRAALAGIKDDLALEGAMLRCPPDAVISEYVEKLKKDRPDLWATTSFPVSSSTPSAGRAAGGAGDDWSAVKADLNSKVPSRVASAINKIGSYLKSSGKMPPGFEQ